MSIFDKFQVFLRGTEPSPKTPIPVSEQRPPVSDPEKVRPLWIEQQRARAERLWGEGEWDNVGRVLERILGAKTARVEPVNVGDPEVKGFTRENIHGREVEVPKVRCDDRKINDPEHGLYAVMDGVSKGHGAIAAEITSRLVQARLGEELDLELQRLRDSSRATTQMIDALVKTRIQSVVREAEQAVVEAERSSKEYKGAASTLALVKCVELPSSVLRAYVAHVGDSRVYALTEEEELRQLTQDDSRLNALVQQGEVDLTPEQLDEIDQCADPDTLSDQDQRLFRLRNTMTASIGSVGQKSQYLEVLAFNVRPDDILILTTDGVHDNSLRTEMATSVLDAEDIRAAERALQEDAVGIQHDRSNPRSKRDDVSAVVMKVERRTKRNIERAVVVDEAPEGLGYDPADVPGWRKELAALRGLESVHELSNEDRLRRVNYEYWIARAAADEARLRAEALRERPVMQVGDVVHMDFARKNGTVISGLTYRVTGFSTVAGERVVSLRGETDHAHFSRDEEESVLVRMFAAELEQRMAREQAVMQEKLKEDAFIQAEIARETKRNARMADAQKAAAVRAKLKDSSGR